MKKIIFILFAVSISMQSLFAQLEKVNNLLETFKKDSSLLNASWSFCLLDNQSGKVLAEKDKFLSLLPASSMKIITPSTALALLGENYRYQTSITYTGTLEKGVLHGDIIIKGSGDPSLGSDRMPGVPSYNSLIQMMVDSIQKSGIRSIEGRLIADESCFTGSNIPSTWNWSDIGNYFGAGAAGINFNENSYDIFFKPCVINNTKPILSRLEPNMSSLLFTNLLIANDTVGNMDDAYIYGAPYTNERTLAGPVPLSDKEFSISGAMPDPAIFLAQLLQDSLEAKNIQVKQSVSTSRILANEGIAYSSSGVSIFNYYSPPLKDIISITNQKSINLYAEALLKTIAKEKGQVANTENGIRIIQKYWQSKGIDLSGFYMKDGSGLSRHNAVSPYHFTQILLQISKENYFKTFKNSLAVAGKSGTLKGMGIGTLAEGNIFAKSGTVERGISYTGYVNTSSGKTLSFSIMFNNYNSKNLVLRQKISKLMAAMAGI
jgi:D-alanyl-D-alanine carboxypeptidase/D-alanyl-D-alanine-endopeptidase (penicillin-binding protein 4)